MRSLVRGYAELSGPSSSDLLTVPSGHTYHVKSLVLGNSTTSTTHLNASVYITDTYTFAIHQGIVVPPKELVLVELDLTLQAGNKLRVSNNTQTNYLRAVVGAYDFS